MTPQVGGWLAVRDGKERQQPQRSVTKAAQQRPAAKLKGGRNAAAVACSAQRDGAVAVAQ